MPTTIVDRRVIVSQEGPGSGLNTAADPAYGLPWQSVQLTREYFAPRGGVPYRIGEDWQVRLSLVALDSAGVWDGIDLTGLTGTDLLLTIWDALTNAVVAALSIGAGITVDPDQATSRTAGGKRGDLVVSRSAADTASPGRYRWALAAKLATKRETVAEGWITFGSAVPS